MKVFLWNLILALLWGAMTGRFDGANLMLGFALGYVVLWWFTFGSLGMLSAQNRDASPV